MFSLQVCIYFTRAQNSERRPVVFLHPFIFIFVQQAQCSGGSVELVDLEPLYSFPITSRIRIRRYTLEQHGGGTVWERTVDNVRMTSDPANVGHATEYVSWFVSKNILKEGNVKKGVNQLGLYARALTFTMHAYHDNNTHEKISQILIGREQCD